MTTAVKVKTEDKEYSYYFHAVRLKPDLVEEIKADKKPGESMSDTVSRWAKMKKAIEEDLKKPLPKFDF